MNNDISATIVMGIVFLVAFVWISLFARLLRGDELLPFERRRETPWGVIAVLLSFVLLIGSQIAVGVALDAAPASERTAAQTGTLLIWTAIAILAATSASIGLIHLLTSANRTDFGISLEHVPQDLVTGIYAFFILAPITFSIQYVFVYVFELESRHPLIELLKQDSSGVLFGVVTVLAVVVAPISEEYFFRVLLQGWLERVLLFRTAHGHEFGRDARANASPSDGGNVHGSTRLTPEYNSPPESLFAARNDLDRGFIAAAGPIVISAAIFALMHWSHGPDPAALFVLALGLGYLYQRTHRWLPSVVTHACLNGTTMLMLWYGLDQLAT
ncbi:MAG: JDVT-CTERM system glutamic-type intramembrane protease [Pirellulaceae bacterium]